MSHIMCENDIIYEKFIYCVRLVVCSDHFRSSNNLGASLRKVHSEIYCVCFLILVSLFAYQCWILFIPICFTLFNDNYFFLTYLLCVLTKYGSLLPGASGEIIAMGPCLFIYPCPVQKYLIALSYFSGFLRFRIKNFKLKQVISFWANIGGEQRRWIKGRLCSGWLFWSLQYFQPIQWRCLGALSILENKLTRIDSLSLS